MSRITFAILGIFSLLAATTSLAETYPSKPIRIILPWAAGGPTDVIARIVADKLSAEVKQPVIVDNKPGANGIIGTTQVARAPADGYTLLFALPETNVLNPMIYKKITYKLDDFQPVAFIGDMPFALISGPKSKVNSVAELTKLARAEPGKVSGASWGTGSTAHTAIAMMEQSGKLSLLHVPFAGVAPAIVQLISGEVDTMFMGAQAAKDLELAGKVRILGLASQTRADMFPSIPTLAEQGLAVDVNLWYGLSAPAGTPKHIIEYLNRQVNAVLQDPAAAKILTERGLTVKPQSVQEYGRFVESEITRWTSIIKTKNIQIEN